MTDHIRLPYQTWNDDGSSADPYVEIDADDARRIVELLTPEVVRTLFAEHCLPAFCGPLNEAASLSTRVRALEAWQKAHADLVHHADPKPPTPIQSSIPWTDSPYTDAGPNSAPLQKPALCQNDAPPTDHAQGASDKIAVINAFNDGKPIEYRLIGTDKWHHLESWKALTTDQRNLADAHDKARDQIAAQAARIAELEASVAEWAVRFDARCVQQDKLNLQLDEERAELAGVREHERHVAKERDDARVDLAALHRTQRGCVHCVALSQELDALKSERNEAVALLRGWVKYANENGLGTQDTSAFLARVGKDKL